MKTEELSCKPANPFMSLICSVKMLNLAGLILVTFLFNGCATPNVGRLSHTEILQPDEDDDLGGTFLESGDIRTIATRMSVALLSTPEISNHFSPVRIAIAPVRNSTHFIIDKNIFMKRLRIELNRVARGKIRFLSQNMGQRTRNRILRERDEELWDNLINEAANTIVNSSVIASGSPPPTIAVIPVRNTNIVNLNADSFTALIRARISERARGKVYFLGREKNGKVLEEILDEKDIKNMGLVKSRRIKDLYGADYFLTGEFIAKSLFKQNTTLVTRERIGRDQDDPGVIERKRQEYREKPNVDKYLNVMLVDAETGATLVEKLIKVERKMKSGLGRADYLLTGEISSLSKATSGGVRSDYIIMSFQLVDPVTNEVLWEDAYETKKKSSSSVLYR